MHQVHAVVLIRFSISINIDRPSTTVDVKDAKQQHLSISHVTAH